MSNHQSITVVKEQPIDTAMEKAIQEQAGTVENAPAPEARPGWLPEKFRSPEDLAKAYSELEKRFSTPSEKPKSAPETEANPSGGLNLDVYATEYAETGQLSQESIQKLVQSGIPESVISNYLQGVQALSDAQTNQIYGMVGGETQYNTMLEWASESLDEAEIDAFNAIMDGGNSAAMQMAVRGLHARYSQINGQPSKLIQGETTGPSGGAFRSVAEVTAAMKDPRYQKDAAYRRDVENRLRNSDILGVTQR